LIPTFSHVTQRPTNGILLISEAGDNIGPMRGKEAFHLKPIFLQKISVSATFSSYYYLAFGRGGRGGRIFRITTEAKTESCLKRRLVETAWNPITVLLTWVDTLKYIFTEVICLCKLIFRTDLWVHNFDLF
jgi:hypothetical protein